MVAKNWKTDATKVIWFWSSHLYLAEWVRISWIFSPVDGCIWWREIQFFHKFSFTVNFVLLSEKARNKGIFAHSVFKIFIIYLKCKFPDLLNRVFHFSWIKSIPSFFESFCKFVNWVSRRKKPLNFDSLSFNKLLQQKSRQLFTKTIPSLF